MYPLDRAFIIEVHRGADLDAGTCRGRVEHITSGHTRGFTSLVELFEILAESAGAAVPGPTPSVMQGANNLPAPRPEQPFKR